VKDLVGLEFFRQENGSKAAAIVLVIGQSPQRAKSVDKGVQPFRPLPSAASQRR